MNDFSPRFPFPRILVGYYGSETQAQAQADQPHPQKSKGRLWDGSTNETKNRLNNKARKAAQRASGKAMMQKALPK